MKQVVARAGKVVVVEVPAPPCKDNEVLVRTAYSAVSTGTEMWTIDATSPLSPGKLASDVSMLKKAIKLTRNVLSQEGIGGVIDYSDAIRHPEVALGYSSSGVVIQVGKNVTDVGVGEKVACAGEGKACHAEVVSVPRNLLSKIPDGVEMRDAAFTSIGAIALHAFRQSGAQLGDAIAVIGVGLVGNLVVQIAKASGCRVAALDLRDDRLALAREVGADIALRSDDPLLESHLLHFTNGRGVDAVLICAAASSSELINLASRIARERGTITVVGRVGMNLERKDYYQKELELVMSRSLGPGRYDPLYEEKCVDYPIEYVRWTLNRNMDAFLELLKSNKVTVNKLIGGEFTLDRTIEAYDALERQSKVAVVLTYNHTEPQLGSAALNYCLVTPKRVSGKINTAVVGPGNFAKETLIPILRRNSDFNLRWVVSSNPTHATQIARRYRFEYCTCDFETVLNDKETHLVVISTPNNLHYPMVMASVKAGKTVFVEKPLCLTREELEDIKKAYRENKVPIIVGFNRRYSPLVLTLKEMMSKLNGPFTLAYRVNAGFIPTSRWVQDPQVGGGRIIAECCHFFDLFNFLLKSNNPQVVSVSAADVNGSTSVAKDNIIVTLRYPGGSSASLVYTALGHRDMERERLEVFGDGTSMVLDDFKALKIWGARPVKTKMRRQDKGHTSEFEELSKFMQGTNSSIISLEESVAATQLSFDVNDLLRIEG